MKKQIQLLILFYLFPTSSLGTHIGETNEKIFKPILIILTATLLTSCCLIDHTDTIKEVAEPMLKELEAFYKTNKRFPNTKERDVMLEKSGCEMRRDICMYEGKELIITESEEGSAGDYSMLIDIIDKETSYTLARCGFGIRSNHTVSPVGCSKKSCIQLRQ